MSPRVYFMLFEAENTNTCNQHGCRGVLIDFLKAAPGLRCRAHDFVTKANPTGSCNLSRGFFMLFKAENTFAISGAIM